MPLGEAASRGLGLSLFRVRIILLVLVSVPTTIATLVIGPLSFVGLMAPHLARMLGFQRALLPLFASAILGGSILFWPTGPAGRSFSRGRFRRVC
nr:iron chelate uptake ABC transporter family permease subunit [Mesorhizobium sp.]